MANYYSMRSDVLERIRSIVIRLEEFNTRARDLLRSAVKEGEAENEHLRHLEDIEQKLEAMEERLRKLEQDMRAKESPPETFGTEHRFSTGTHWPGLG